MPCLARRAHEAVPDHRPSAAAQQAGQNQVPEPSAITLGYDRHHKFEIDYRASTSLASTLARVLISPDLLLVWGTREVQWRAVRGCGSCNQSGYRTRHAVTILGAKVM